MPVPIVNYTDKDIRDEIVAHGGSVPLADYTFIDLVNASEFPDRFDLSYTEGAVAKNDIVNSDQFRNYGGCYNVEPIVIEISRDETHPTTIIVVSITNLPAGMYVYCAPYASSTGNILDLGWSEFSPNSFGVDLRDIAVWAEYQFWFSIYNNPGISYCSTKKVVRFTH